MRARGLKLTSKGLLTYRAQSRPVRARGLKCEAYPRRHREADVAPREGAWIEMTMVLPSYSTL